MTYRIVIIGPLLRARREPKNKLKKGIPKKPQHVFFHVFAQTTHVVAGPRAFACVGIPATRLYVPCFIEIRSGVSEALGVKIWPFPLLWLVAFTTASMWRCDNVGGLGKHVKKHVLWFLRCTFFNFLLYFSARAERAKVDRF